MTEKTAQHAVLAVTGLALEARIVAGPGVHVVAGGGNPSRLAQRIEALIERGVSGLISVGIAGGLAAGLAPGTWIVAREVVTPHHLWSTDPAWNAVLRRRLAGSIEGTVAGVDGIVPSAAGKRALFEATQASAVDNESHIVAAAAHAHGLPFAVFRVIADPHRRGLPHAATVSLRSDGRVDRPAVIRSLLTHPRQLPALARTALDTRIALRALLRGCRCLGPGLGYADLGELVLDVA